MKTTIIRKRRYLIVCIPLTFLISLAYFSWSYKSTHAAYWQSMGRAQTVDFNLLASTSTGTVSGIIKKQDKSKAIEFVNSNYCHSFIAIERCLDEQCRGQETIASTRKNGIKSRCGSMVTEQALRIPIYDDITSHASVFFEHAYVSEPSIVSNSATPIGYLVLAKSQPPTALADFYDYISKEFYGHANSSRHDLYRENIWTSVLLMFSLSMMAMVLRSTYVSSYTSRLISEAFIEKIKGVKNGTI